ncbi:MAG: hypothetical protein ACFHWX_03275 [Bacteroidota bacterium]
MKELLIIGSILLLTASCIHSPKPPPLVYDVEDTGLEFQLPILPDYEDLPTVRPLTDPFEWSDGSGRVTKFKDWSRRRSEIKAEIEHYEVGEKPSKIDDLKASYSKEDSLLTVNVTVNESTLTLTSKVVLPEGEGPFPAVIGIGRGTGSLPPDVFEGRKLATVAFNFSQVMAHTQVRGEQPINKLYPDQIEIGAYSAWPWGVSRIIDGLEIVARELNLDMKHIAITGCSFAGKMALFSGAFDERIALTIAQEPGGGGAAAWRVSQTLGNVETLSRTNYSWFKEDMRRFGNSVYKLPHDHHELVAMIAPRAVLILGNPDYQWLADESGYVSCVAASKVWEDFGIADRFGFSIVGDHGHCRLPENQYPEVSAFIDKFLFGDTTANTLVRKHPFPNVNVDMWIDGWTGTSTFPEPDTSNITTEFYEVECGNLGADWEISSDEERRFASVKPGLNSAESPPTGVESIVSITFSVNRDTKYYFYALANCSSDQDDSFWVKIDDGEFELANGLVTVGWSWVYIDDMELIPGDHTLTIAYREDGGKLDKIGITTYEFGPAELEEKPALNICD